MKNNTIVVGIGHPFRGDDSLGPKAITQLQPLLPKGIDTKTIVGDIAELLDIFENYTQVFLVDIIFTQQALPGKRYRLEGVELKQFANCCRTSTHAFDISQVLALADNLGILPSKLVIYGIEGQDFSQSEALSAEVQAQLEPLVYDLYKEILMHEHSLMNDLFRKIAEIAKNENANHVSKIYVKIGALAHISPSHFQEHFDEMRPGTVAESAEVVITKDDDIHSPTAQDITLISVDIPEA